MFLVCALIYIALLAPWWVRNYFLLHAFVPFTTGSAQILYLGNNPRNPAAGISWSTDTDPLVLARDFAPRHQTTLTDLGGPRAKETLPFDRKIVSNRTGAPNHCCRDQSLARLRRDQYFFCYL